MKTIPPICPEPETGRKYWRSLEQLGDQPEFREWLEREFPDGASIAPDGESRRDWMKLMSASFLLAGLGGMAAGCRRPEEQLLPFGKQPENYLHGGWKYFATAMPSRGSAVPLLAKWTDGRPTKLEPNSLCPGSAGTDAQTQAAILNLYDPDRAIRHTFKGNDVEVAKVADMVSGLSQQFAGNAGEGLWILAERSSSATRARLQRALGEKLGRARWVNYEPVDFGVHRAAASTAFAAEVQPRFRLDEAKRILSLDADLFGAESEASGLMRGFAKGRKPGDDMNRLYVVESLMTITGGQADHRLRVKPSEVIKVAAQVAAQLVTSGGLGATLQKLAAGSPAPAGWAAECAKDLLAHKGASVVVAGYTQPPAVHLIAAAINEALGAFGKTVELSLAETPADSGSIADLVTALQAGKVDTLVILGGNPAYNAPADLNFPAAAKKAKNVVRLGYYEDETFEVATWSLAQAHFLEAWGDARGVDGTLLPVQPLVQPLFGGLTDLEVLARLLGHPITTPYELVRETFKGLGGADENAWNQFLHDGFLTDSASKPARLSFDATRVAEALSKVSPTAGDGYELVLFRDAKADDGRNTNNGWLQELPEPVTKVTWENVVLVSPATAKELGIESSRRASDGQYIQFVVKLSVGGTSIEGPAWVQPGLADGVVGCALGYGRSKVGRVGRGSGFNAYPLFTSTSRHHARGVKLDRVFRRHMVAVTQEHGLMEGRPVVREATVAEFAKKPDFAKHMDLDGHMGHVPRNDDGTIKNIYQNPYRANPWTKSDFNQWAMTIDLASCTGCSACVIACQAENNIPIVGKDQVARGREMQWMRIDRYYSFDPGLPTSGDAAAAAMDPQMVVQPMLCQHCENAPCESVCPVNATVHDSEGLNIMAYNRCIGTRYCSNNCPYKVRRFNFFDFNKREISFAKETGSLFFNIESPLYHGPLGPNKYKETEWEVVKLVKNPDVTVRMRGVMEKCTFCVQRIAQARIAIKNVAKDSGNVRVPGDMVKTACQQACPADAIVFGNTMDPEARVNSQIKDPRNYTVLGFLDNRPRVTYLARIRNPNPAMPDKYSEPDSIRDYKRMRNENPFEEHGHGAPAGHEPAGAAPAKGGHA